MKDLGAIYARVSGPADPRTASIETQIEATRALLTDCTVTDDDIFIERFTGKLLHERVELSRLRARVREKHYKVIGIYALDRISRNATHLAVIFEEAERFGCSILSATEEIDKTPEGELMRSIRGYVAEVERLKIQDRTSRGTKLLLQQGKIIGSGVARLGYKYDKLARARVINPSGAEIVRQIFALAAAGNSINQIVLKFNGQKVPTPQELAGRPRGKRGWVKEAVRAIIRDPSYYGAPMQWQGKALGDPTPQIIDRDEWEQAQLTIDRKRTYAGSITETHRFRLLTGMIFCRCGATMTTAKSPTWNRKSCYRFYLCISKRDKSSHCTNGRIQIDQVDEIVWAKVLEMTRDKSVLQQAIAKARDNEAGLRSELEAHQKLIIDAGEKAGRLGLALAGLSDPAVLAPLQAQLKALDKEVGAHRQAVAELSARLVGRDTIKHSLGLMRAYLEGKLEVTMEGSGAVFHGLLAFFLAGPAGRAVSGATASRPASSGMPGHHRQ